MSETALYDGVTAPRWGKEENEYQIVAPRKPYVYGTNSNNALVHAVAYMKLRWWEHDYHCMRRLQSPRIFAYTKCGRSIRLHDTSGKACEVPKPDAVMCAACQGKGRNFPRGKAHEVPLEIAKVKLGCVEQPL